jgi:membrane-bound serine protease (ClpP class)
MQLLIWSLLLLAVGMVLIVLEVFVPSGGILGLLATLALVSAGAVGFFAGPKTGLAILATIVLAVPAIIAAALKIWPNTPMGRRVLLNVPTADEMRPDNEQLRELKKLIGRVGVARTVMLPSGEIDIDGRLIDAIAPGVAIEPGQRVRVVDVRGARVFVQPVTGAESASRSSNANPLDQPIESLGIEDFEDPLLGNQNSV